MGTTINTPGGGDSAAGIIVGVILALAIVGIGAYGLGILPPRDHTSITVTTPAPVVPAPSEKTTK